MFLLCSKDLCAFDRYILLSTSQQRSLSLAKTLAMHSYPFRYGVRFRILTLDRAGGTR